MTRYSTSRGMLYSAPPAKNTNESAAVEASEGATDAVTADD